MPATASNARSLPSTPFPARSSGLVAGLALAVLTGATAPASAACERVVSTAATRAVRAPAPARNPNSGSCAGLALYEVIRSTTEQARCSAGNVVTGGSCSGLGGGPALDTRGWECEAGSRATAICASLCSRAPEASGACCEGTTCSVTQARDCASRGGAYLGDGAVCDASSCEAHGACCISGGGRGDTCFDDQTPPDCAARGGIYLGDDVACDSDDACAACSDRPECAP